MANENSPSYLAAQEYFRVVNSSKYINFPQRFAVTGIDGSLVITNWLKDAVAGTNSIDFVFFGESNVAYQTNSGLKSEYRVGLEQYDSVGWSEGYIYGCLQNGINMYSAAAAPIGLLNAGSPNNFIGYKVSWNQSGTKPGLRDGSNGATGGAKFGGPSELFDYYTSGASFGAAGIADAQGSTYGGLLQPYGPIANQGVTLDFLWVPSGSTMGYNSWLYYRIDKDCPLYTYARANNKNLKFRVMHGMNSVKAAGQFQLSIGSSSSGVFTSYDTGVSKQVYDSAPTGSPVGSWGWTASTFTSSTTSLAGHTAFAYLVNSSAATRQGITGEVALAWANLYSDFKGVGAHSINWHNSGSLLNLYHDALGADNNTTKFTIRRFLQEIKEKQVDAGGTGRVCVVITGGLCNPCTVEGASFDTLIGGIKDTFTNAWNSLGYSEENLTFILQLIHSSGTGGSATDILDTTGLRDKAINYVKTNPNITGVSVMKLTSYESLTGAPTGFTYWSDPTGELSTSGVANKAHLSQNGYHQVGNIIIGKLLEQRSQIF